jgi:DNA-binding CsgD family transcriptional regulator/anti-anti-sigma regulatory factor/anti-sigma regulatory factor (Ser/Thr protein kinase)
MSIVVDTTRDLENGATTVRVDGMLTFATAPTVRTVLGKCASECPTAVIVDLAALEVASPALLVVFAGAAQRATAQWGVPLLLCRARPDVRRGISLFRTFTEVYDSPASAAEALRDWVPRWRHQHLSPAPASAALARHLVAQACTEWGLSDLQERAVLIVSELANNAIEHAATSFDLTVSYTAAYLRIAVQDGGPTLPSWIPDSATNPAALDRGRGLYVVDAIATAWNTTGVTDGKIVWALLRTRPPGSPLGIDHPASEPPYQHGLVEVLADAGSHYDGPATKPRGASVRQLATGEDLSDRETEVLSYLPTMLTAGEIGAEMHVSINTVKAHLRSIYTKLGVSRRQDAVFRAYERGLLS